jgi:hypothetical protein
MRGTMWRTVALAAVALLLLVAAACGGDDDESAADTTAAAATDGATTEEPAATSEDEEESDESTDFASAESCAELAELGNKVSSAIGGAGGDTEQTKEFLNEFADEAPDEIADDFQVIADAYTKIVDALGDANVEAGETPDPEALAELQRVAGEIDQAELEEANRNITAWVTENCGTLGTTTTD